MNWISVEDKLPDNNDPVIVFDRFYDGITTGYKSSWYSGLETHNNRDDCDVTHWMPLPKDPPTEE